VPLLFSYGTLQRSDVQLETFGRRLIGWADEIIGFEQQSFRVDDPAFAAKSGTADHTIVVFDGKADSRVKGTVFAVTDAELAKSDAYEPEGYLRVEAALASGKRAWVYATRDSVRG
jgi:gamma-glutamylcyclotransferase (GGCT)/AIG2-like uncharacterized protein YtfP